MGLQIERSEGKYSGTTGTGRKTVQRVFHECDNQLKQKSKAVWNHIRTALLFIYRTRTLFFQVIGNLLYIITTATHHKDEITRFYHIIHLIVIESQCIVSYLKNYSFAFTRIQMNFPEALQFLYRARNRRYLILHIQLDYFLSCTLTGISHFYRHLRMDACTLPGSSFKSEYPKSVYESPYPKG